MAKHVAIYPGSFDPPTNGHLNLVKRGALIYDEVIVAVAESTSKRYLFNTEERVQLWKKLLKNVSGVKVETFSGLLVDYAARKKSNVILRGLRNVTDFEYEIQMATTNRTLKPKIETVFMMTEGIYAHLSSTLIKEIVILGGSVKGMVPPLIERELYKRLGPKSKKSAGKKK